LIVITWIFQKYIKKKQPDANDYEEKRRAEAVRRKFFLSFFVDFVSIFTARHVYKFDQHQTERGKDVIIELECFEDSLAHLDIFTFASFFRSQISSIGTHGAAV
jgi:hypothetical protein